MSRTISILGSTGSIGRQTLDVAEQLGLTVAALTAHSSVKRMEEQADARKELEKAKGEKPVSQKMFRAI